jgi:hypothetical protein
MAAGERMSTSPNIAGNAKSKNVPPARESIIASSVLPFPAPPLSGLIKVTG